MMDAGIAASGRWRSFLITEHTSRASPCPQKFIPQQGYGGLWTLIYSDQIAVETHNKAGEQVLMNEEVLVRLDYDGQLQEMYRHPAFSQWPKTMQLFGFYHNQFFFFNKQETDVIQDLSLDEMKKIPLPKRRVQN